MTNIFRLIPFLLLISMICFYPITKVFADDGKDTAENELDISLSQTGNLFEISNMKPGDWAPRTITVQNSGSEDFVYQMQVQNNGDEKLFNELMLEIKEGDTELYLGKMAAFKSLSERSLASSAEETLDITIRFPEHLGNEFQGLETAFVFSFIAEGKGSPPVQVMTAGQVASFGSDWSSPTSTSSKIVNGMLFGFLLMAGGIVFMFIRRYREVFSARF